MEELSAKEANTQLKVLRNLKNTEMEIAVVLVEEQLEIGKIIALAPGSQILLDHPAKKDVVMKVNGRPFAEGIVVQHEEKYAFRINEIVDASEQ